MSEVDTAAGFPAATREQWTALVECVLKGADFETTLVSHSYDGLRVEPLYPKAEGAAPLLRARHAPWRVAQAVDHPDAAAANALVLADLEGGADALTLRFAGAPSARGFGLAVGDVDELDRALAGVMLDIVAVRVEGGFRGRDTMALAVDLAARRGHALGALDLDLGLDPIGAFASTGAMSAPWSTVAGRLSDNLANLAGRGFAGRLALADGRPYHEAGGSEAQELAAVLATALAYLRALEAGGHAIEAARNALSFLLVADADEFLTVAKFRALRRLWTRIEAACGLTPAPLRLHAETAWRMTTRRDPFTNVLRGTIAAFSAGIGGADTIGVLPFTAALGLPDAFARRIARNTQLILQEESNLWRVADPVAGAGGFEALTGALAEEAWTRFQEIEREGGIVESLAAGTLQARIAETRARRDAAIATRRDAITGTSEFPDLQEGSVSVLLDTAPFSLSPLAVRGRAGAERRPGEGATAAEPRPAPPPHPVADATRPLPAGGERGPAAQAGGPGAIPLPSHRLSEPYERLRDRSDAILARTGFRPRIFLAALGTPAEFSARAGFATNAFEAGGIEVVAGGGGTPEDAAAAFAGAGTAFACLCASDVIYASHAAAAAARLRDAGAKRLILAGRPGDRLGEYDAAGIDGYLFAGCDLVQLLSDLVEPVADVA